MADPRIKVRPPSNDPQRPPTGLPPAPAPKPPVIFVQPEIIAALNRIATAFENTAAALAARPVDVAAPDVADGVPRTWAQVAEAARTAACPSEMWSHEYFRESQIDPYWLRCTELGPHTEHKDSNTGATWVEAV